MVCLCSSLENRTGVGRQVLKSHPKTWQAPNDDAADDSNAATRIIRNQRAACLVSYRKQGSGLRFSDVAALAMAERVSDTRAVVELMNNVFRHSESGPLRAETVLRSCRAQVCVVGR